MVSNSVGRYSYRIGNGAIQKVVVDEASVSSKSAPSLLGARVEGARA
jgi:hypothetical protein